MYAWLPKEIRSHQIPKTGFTDSVCWEFNPGPLKNSQVLLIAEPSFYSPCPHTLLAQKRQQMRSTPSINPTCHVQTHAYTAKRKKQTKGISLGIW